MLSLSKTEKFINYTFCIIIILNSYTKRMITKTKTKRWGNSIGIVIPQETVEALGIKQDEFIIVDVQKKENVLRELFGNLKFKKTATELLKKVRKDLEGKWLK